MAKAKQKPKALFTLKQDFYDSLDNVAQEGIMLIQSVEMTLRLGGLSDEASKILKERISSFRASLSSDE